MLKKTKKISFFAMLLYMLLITWQTFLVIRNYKGILPVDGRASNVSINLFFSLQPGGYEDNFVIDIIMLILIPTLGSGLFVYFKNNNMFSLIQQRQGYFHFFKKSFKNIIFNSIFISVITNIYQVGLINWFYYPFFFKSLNSKTMAGYRPGYFSTNEMIDLITYIVLAAIGWAIFSILVFSIGLFVNKNTFYLVLGPIVCLGLTLIIILTNVNNIVLRIISYIVLPYTLLAPGQYALAGQLPPINSYLSFLISMLLYLIIATELIRIWYKRKKTEG